jgi:predicted nuclease of predicted toxin-antitoxin system
MGISLEVARWLRGAGHDVLHLREQSLERLPDSDIFAKALAENRVVLTFDLDFGEIAAIAGRTEAKVVVFRLRNARATNVIGRLASVIATSRVDLDRGGVVISVEEHRHRIRRLPIGRA